MNRRVSFCAGILTGTALTCGAWLAVQALPNEVRAQAGTTGQKNTSRIVLENDRVRVKDATFYPGDENPGMHTHDLPHVGVIIEGGTLMFRSPNEETETVELEAGGVGYREANVTHEPINTGSNPVRVIEVEIK
ncbi:MAG: cupin domain-containing protein [Luteitalea sp.]|nr:cupin domain-containing protein [Luteitalea sp.]